MRNLSKSKIIAFRQCPKKLWLSMHRPDLQETVEGAEMRFTIGYQVGDIAQQLYNRKKNGVLIDAQKDGFKEAFLQTQTLLNSPQPIFEAGFQANGLLAFADVLKPIKQKDTLSWHMLEVKSATTVKDYYIEDIAIQTYIAKSAGTSVKKVSLAHINNDWVYMGDGQYDGILTEVDVTKQSKELEPQVITWVKDAKATANSKDEPQIAIGKHCSEPFECEFFAHCSKDIPVAEHSVNWLPGRWKKALNEHVEAQQIIEMKDVPDELLSEVQLKVKQVTLSGQTYFDRKATKKVLAQHGYPAYFLDFETAQFAIPIWKGWRPYQQIPFQFSLHILKKDLNLNHEAFLDLSGEDPTLGFVESLIKACRKRGPIFVFNMAFEASRIKELAERYPNLSKDLLAIVDRLVDLLPIAKDHYYAGSQQGSWSIKKLLPAICPDLNYSDLDGIKDGGMAMDAYVEAIHPETSQNRKHEIYDQLLAYCKLDTYAMVKIWSQFTGINIPE